MNKISTMKHVSIITLINVRNYGTALQALATQEIFKSLGCEADFINFVRKGQNSIMNRLKKWCSNYSLKKRIFYAPLILPTIIKQESVFKDFLRRRINLQDRFFTTPEDFKKYPIAADIYCTGSDQTWNSGWNNGIIGAMFLDFVPDYIKKIAYSASFGKQKLDKWEKEETKRLLSRYSAISVREKTGVDICEDLGVTGVVQVLDPTLQVNREFWIRYAGKRKLKNKYVLVYQLNSNKDFDKFASEYARRKGLKLIRFCWRYDQALKCGRPLLTPQVEDFVNAICYADTVITDSFHATAFSINMNTDFISIYPQKYGGRLESILQLTHLQQRHLLSYDDFSLADAPKIDFTEANCILEQERERGWTYLKNAIK